MDYKKDKREKMKEKGKIKNKKKKKRGKIFDVTTSHENLKPKLTALGLSLQLFNSPIITLI